MSDYKRPSNDFIDASMMEKLRRYRQQDPGFKKAIEEFADAEAKHGKNDPAEGKIIKPAGPNRSK